MRTRYDDKPKAILYGLYYFSEEREKGNAQIVVPEEVFRNAVYVVRGRYLGEGLQGRKFLEFAGYEQYYLDSGIILLKKSTASLRVNSIGLISITEKSLAELARFMHLPFRRKEVGRTRR